MASSSRHGVRVAVACLAVTVATAGLVSAGSDEMPRYRLAGNPGPGPAQLGAAANLVKQRAAALARARAKMTAVSLVLSGLQAQAEIATENYDRAMADEQEAAAAYRAAAARLAAARRAEGGASARVGAQAAADFESQGGLGPMTVMFGGSGGPGGYLNELGVQQVLAQQRTDSLAARQADTAVAAAFRQQAANLLATEKADVASVHALQLVAQAAVGQQAAAVAASRSAQGQAAELLAIAKSDNAKLQAEHRAAALAQQRAAALQARQAATAVAGKGSGAGSVSNASPAWTTGSGASAAQGDVAASWAQTQIGKPYAWGAAGPGSYDCSGLAMDAWGHAGVQLGHYTGWQWTSGPHIPLDQLRRGDLVFFATNTADPVTIHHVGIYIGGNMMVDAPYTGTDVRIDSIFQAGLIGATRPAG